MAKAKLNKKTSEFLVTVSLGGQEWIDTTQQAKEHLMKNVAIKGFRKGKVPKNIALKHLKPADIYSHALSKKLNDLAKTAAGQITKDIIVLAAPSYTVEKVDEQELMVKFVYPIYPEMTLSEYKNLGIKYEERKFNNKFIDEEIKKIQQIKTIKTPKPGPVSKGDVVKFNYEGLIDGKTFPNGKAENFELEIGSGQFIPGFW